MTILITGSNGFIGRHVMELMKHQDMDVVGLDKTYTEDAGDHYAVDILNSKTLQRVCDEVQPEVVVHLAAAASVRDGMRNPFWYLENNIPGTVNVLQSSAKYAKRFIFAASGGTVYGTVSRDELPVPHYRATYPNDIYGVSKLAGENLVRIFCEAEGCQWYNLRFPNVYGPGQNPYGEAGVVAILSRKMLDGELVTINGDGTHTRDFAYVEDVAHWILYLSSGISHPSGNYNVGTGIETSVNEIYQGLRKIIGGSDVVLHGPEMKGEALYISLYPDFKCTTPLEEGLRLTVDYYRKEGKRGAL